MASEYDIQLQLEALRKARNSGLKRVRFGEREMEYRSDADLRAAIRDLEDELEKIQTGRRRSRYRLTVTDKGL